MRGAWPATDEMTLAGIRTRWGRWYYVERTPGGRYRATRPDGYVLPEADTPEGLDSAIRADWSRWGAR